MLSILAGAIVAAAGGAGLWYFLPNGDVVHPLARKPLLDSMIPITIVCALVIGVALIISGFF